MVKKRYHTDVERGQIVALQKNELSLISMPNFEATWYQQIICSKGNQKVQRGKDTWQSNKEWKTTKKYSLR